jgi:hypothetical protein
LLSGFDGLGAATCGISQVFMVGGGPSEPLERKKKKKGAVVDLLVVTVLGFNSDRRFGYTVCPYLINPDKFFDHRFDF